MNRVEAKQLVAVVIGAFPNARVTPATPGAYENAIRDLEYAHASAAIARLLATAKFMPAIAEIREAAVEVACGGDQRSGAEAWGDVVRAVGTFGINRIPTFADPLVWSAVEAIGWRTICNSDETDPAPRAKFADAYNRLARSARRTAAMSRGAMVPQLEHTPNPKLATRTRESLPVGDLIKRIGTGQDPESDGDDKE